MIPNINMDMEILVADDIQNMRSVIKAILRKLGFENVTTVSDGTRAWDVVNQKKIDLIISDWNMPEMPGIELLRKVRESESYHTIPFLMITAENVESNVIEAGQAGVTDYIVKPFTPDTLKGKIQKIFL